MAVPEMPIDMSSPTHASAPVRHAVRLVLGLVLLVGVACSSPSAIEAPPSEPSTASTQPFSSPGRRRWPGMDRIPRCTARPVPHPARWPWQPRHPRPAWRSGSPGLVADGSQIAYVQRDGTSAQIVITDPQGTKPQPLLKDYPAKLSNLFSGQPGLVARWIADRDGWIQRRPADGTARTIGTRNRHRGIRRDHGRERARVIRWPPP